MNIALEASEIRTSHVSPWEDLYAINNGIDPQHSGDNAWGAYGNWDGTQRQWHWVEYRWDEPWLIGQSDIYWWADGAGIVIPYDTYQEYWDASGNEWRLLPNAVGNGTERDKYNITNFDPVITQGIRVHMVSTISTGILEWRVWGKREMKQLNTTASIDRPLKPGQKSRITVTALDDQGNTVEGYVFGLKTVIVNNHPDTEESYLVNGQALTETLHSMDLESSDDNGQVSFSIEMPGKVDPGDGISVGLLFADGTPVPGVRYGYFEPGVSPTPGVLVINEIMASNATTVVDEDGDYEDWIELYNKGEEVVNLEGCGLSDDYGNPFRWVFPSKNISPGEFLVIWASGKERDDPLNPLHTNFRISKDGEEVLLTAPGGERLDEIPPTPVPTDKSYGRYPDGADQFFFFSEPTPGSSNISDHYAGILDDVRFSSEPGFYSDTVHLELSHQNPESIIYYTTDGALPDTASLRYTSPIILGYRSEEENQHSMIPTNHMTGAWGWSEPAEKVAKASVIRAVAIKPGYLNSRVKTGSYFIFPEGEQRYPLDVVSVIANHEHLFSDSSGIYVPGDHYVTGNHGTGNYYQRGPEWEHPASVELFYEDLYFQQDVGLRIHGGWSRRLAQKNFRLYARNEYGDNRFYHQVFPDLPYTEYNRLILRAGGNETDFSMFRDPVAQSLVSHFDVDIQAYHPAVVFVNGEYWGIKNLRERYDQHYLARVYGVDPGNVDYLSAEYGNMIVKEGDRNHYQQMLNFLSSNDLSDDAKYQEVHTLMDVNNFMDYYSAQIYYANNDWPYNNIDYWRLRVDYDPAAPKGHDGRWRWLLYDIDRSLGYHTSHTFNMITFLTSRLHPYTNTEWPNLILYNLLDNEGFKNEFLNRIANHLNTAFLPSRVFAVIDSLKSGIEAGMAEHIRRWGNPSSMSAWEHTINKMYTSANHRPDYVRTHITDHFGINGTVNMTVRVNNPAGGHIQIENMDILPSIPGIEGEPYPWTGIYFRKLPLRLAAMPATGYAFSHWTVSGTPEIISDERVLAVAPDADMDLTAHFKRDGEQSPVSYWFFGTDLPNNTPMTSVDPTFSTTEGAGIQFVSALEGYPYYNGHQYWRVGSMERRNSPTSINYLPEANDNTSFADANMRGLQVRQPLNQNDRESALLFSLPTAGYRNVSFRFAAMDEGAADRLVIDYSVSDSEPVWVTTGMELSHKELKKDVYQLFEICFLSVVEANDNPGFMVRIRFEGPETGAFEGNRVTFNNISLHGEAINRIFYSKSEGEINELSTWGTNPDGSGEGPESFCMYGAEFHIHNRAEVELSAPWHVTGKGSTVTAGDNRNPFFMKAEAPFDATLDVAYNATVELQNSQVPQIGRVSKNSKVIFSGQADFVPAGSYFHLVLDGINPWFSDGTIIELRGDLILKGNVAMPDARGSKRYDLYFTGYHDQVIRANGNLIRGYNIGFNKTGGVITFSGDEGGATLSSDNQLMMIMGRNARFNDNGISIYAGNSVNIDGAAGSYNFTGTLILADEKEGVVRGAGSNNNFNVRDSNESQSNTVAVLNNIIIKARNKNGEFRFRDGGNNRFRVKGDFVVKKQCDGRIRFYDNELFIGGDFIIEEGFPGAVDPVRAIRFEGAGAQKLESDIKLTIGDLIIDNPGNLMLRGDVQIDHMLRFDNGRLEVAGGNLPVLGPGAVVSGHGPQRFVDGPLGIITCGLTPKPAFFPLGREGSYVPFTLEALHDKEDEVLYVTELLMEPPSGPDLPAGVAEILDRYHFLLSANDTSTISSLNLTTAYFPEWLTFDEDLLVMVVLGKEGWVNLEGTTRNGMISSDVPFATTGIIALARKAVDVSITTTAGAGGTIEPEGITMVLQGTDYTVGITADDGHHIRELLVNNKNIPEAEGMFSWVYPIKNIMNDITIAVAFAPNSHNDLVIFPNPAGEQLWIQFAQELEHDADVTLVRSDGRVVDRMIIEKGSGRSGHISLFGVEPGIYIARVIYGQHVFSEKVVIL